MPMQEYLDRQCEWEIVILYQGSVDPEDPEGFLAVKVRVNNWLIWLHDIEL